jgi:hypothetical protein
MNARQAANRLRSALYPIAALSLIAGLIHLWVMPEHFEEWWGYGTFFLVPATVAVQSRVWVQDGHVGKLLSWRMHRHARRGVETRVGSPDRH